MNPVFKNKWLFRSPKRVCLKACTYVPECTYYFFLIRKIKANFVFGNEILDGLTAR